MSTDVPFQLTAEHFDGCKRGELLLSAEELEQLNNFLADREPQWRFVSVPATSRGLQLPNAAHQLKQRKVKEGKIEVAKPVKQLPEWAQTFQRMLNKFLQADIARPFADRLPHHSEILTLNSDGTEDVNNHPMTRHSLISQHQREIQQCSQPYCNGNPPKVILSRLEAGQYSTPLEAYNDMYNYLLSGFRHYPPASPHWILLHNVTSLFFANLGAFPLKDNFDGPPSVIHQQPPKPVSKKKREAPNKTRKTTLTSSARKNSITKVSSTETEDAPIKRKETRALQRILTVLSPELQSMLYEQFQDKAVWKSGVADQVQLDEENTPAGVFREILNWGASRVTWQVSASMSKKKQKIAKPLSVELPPEEMASNIDPSGPDSSITFTEGSQKYEDWLSSSDPDKVRTDESSSSSSE